MSQQLVVKLDPLSLQKKVTNPRIIKIAHTFANKWGVSPVEACYRIMFEAAIKLHDEHLQTGT